MKFPYTKKWLLDYAVECPIKFESEGLFDHLIKKAQLDEQTDPEEKLYFSDLREMIKRIYSLNESALLEQSVATTGILGQKNRKASAKRLKKFNDKIDAGFRDLSNKNRKLILAEGDSWFQFPFYVDDIIDHLMEIPEYAIYCIAYGGDWITNIIYEGKYVEELSILRPDVFLVSGAGNDMVGESKVSVMVNPEINPMPKYDHGHQVTSYWDHRLPETWKHFENDKDEVYEGQRYLTDRFYSFIILIKANYYLILHSIRKSRELKDMQIITHGYDYVFPSLKNHFSFRYVLQYIINQKLDTGKWLARPMAIKGINDAVQQRKIVKAMIFILNEMMIELNTKYFPDDKKLIHIDCRNIAPASKDWFDELHLKPHKFKEVALAYQQVINEQNQPSKIVAATDLLNRPH